jgi:hypothetical protein
MRRSEVNRVQYLDWEQVKIGQNTIRLTKYRTPWGLDKWSGAISNFFFFYYSYVHTRLGSFLPPAPTPSLTTHSAPSLSIPSRNYFALISNFVVERV